MRIFVSNFLMALCALGLNGCATSKSVVATGADVSKYEYVVLGTASEGDATLDDLVMQVDNEISKTRLTIVSPAEGASLIKQGKYVLSPQTNIKSEKWDGGHTYITITFYDYDTGQRVIVLKSSGIGLTVAQDQGIALKSIRKKLLEVF